MFVLLTFFYTHHLFGLIDLDNNLFSSIHLFKCENSRATDGEKKKEKKKKLIATHAKSKEWAEKKGQFRMEACLDIPLLSIQFKSWARGYADKRRLSKNLSVKERKGGGCRSTIP